MPKAYASTVLNAPAKAVWALLRDFNGMPQWNPGVADSEIEGGQGGDQVGAVRSFHLKDGAHIRERLLSHSDLSCSYTYNFETTPFEVTNYIATLRITPVTDGSRAFVEWWATYDCEPSRIDEWQDRFRNDVFQNAFNALKKRFGG